MIDDPIEGLVRRYRYRRSHIFHIGGQDTSLKPETIRVLMLIERKSNDKVKLRRT